MFNRLDQNASKEILESIENNDPQLGETIRHLMFVFEDLLRVDGAGIRELLARVDRKVLTVALKGTSELLRNHFLEVMSQRGAEMLKEDMDATGAGEAERSRDGSAADYRGGPVARKRRRHWLVIRWRTNMSAKVLTSEEAAGAESMHWPVAGTLAAGPSAVVEAALEPLSPTVDPAQTAALDVQLERLQAVREKRIQEAVAAGRQEGEAAARESLAANVNSEVERLKQLSKQILGSAPALRKQAEADLVRLAIAIARRILHREIAVDSEALLGLTKAALSVDQREIHKIRTHPDNVALLNAFWTGRAAGGLKFPAMPRLDRGALIIDTARGQLDASGRDAPRRD